MNREDCSLVFAMIEKHGKVMKAFVGGATIQCNTNPGSCDECAWFDVESPSFMVGVEYRVKPKPAVTTSDTKLDHVGMGCT